MKTETGAVVFVFWDDSTQPSRQNERCWAPRFQVVETCISRIAIAATTAETPYYRGEWRKRAIKRERERERERGKIEKKEAETIQ